MFIDTCRGAVNDQTVKDRISNQACPDILSVMFWIYTIILVFTDQIGMPHVYSLSQYLHNQVSNQEARECGTKYKPIRGKFVRVAS